MKLDLTRKFAQFRACVYSQNQGRTALHYAAFLPDRGEIYQHLLALGADERAMDVLLNVVLSQQDVGSPEVDCCRYLMQCCLSGNIDYTTQTSLGWLGH
ncbi:hypothetical protein TNCV_3802851 [Trichonephila clavipes]|nr:hypothetical protein TNCV_3802851 [Trichonephila clavipes]